MSDQTAKSTCVGTDIRALLRAVVNKNHNRFGGSVVEICCDHSAGISCHARVSLVLYYFCRETPNIYVCWMWLADPRPVHLTRRSRPRMACKLSEMCWLSHVFGRDMYMLRTRWQDILQAWLRSVSVLGYKSSCARRGLPVCLMINLFESSSFVLGLGVYFSLWKHTGVLYCFPNWTDNITTSVSWLVFLTVDFPAFWSSFRWL